MDKGIRIAFFILMLGAAPAFAMGDRDPNSEPTNSGARMGDRQSGSPPGVSVTPGAATGGSISDITSTGAQANEQEESMSAPQSTMSDTQMSDTEAIEDTSVSDMSATRSTPLPGSTNTTGTGATGSFSGSGTFSGTGSGTSSSAGTAGGASAGGSAS